MALITNPGWGAAATAAKKKKPPTTSKPTGSFDPSGSLGGYTPKEIASMTPDQIAMVQFGLRMQGAPEPDFDKLREIAQSQVAGAYEAPQQAIKDEREWLRGNYDLSTQAATNFSKAFADIFTGGKSGAEGEQFSLENFGGSYLAGIAARMGQQLISQQTSFFNEEDEKLKNQLADIMEAMPEEAEKIYSELVDNTQDILTAGYKEQLAAWAALEVAKRKMQGGDGAPETKNFSDGTTRMWNPKTGKWDVVTSEATGPSKPRIFQTSEGVFAIDEATGKVVWEKRTGKAKTKKVTTQVVEQPDGSKVLIDKSTGETIRVVAPPDPSDGSSASGTTSNGKPASPSTISNTVARAKDAAETVLERVLANIAVKFPAPDPKVDPEGFERAKAAYQAWLDSGKSFGTAMQRVIVAIAPHLKAIGYTPSQIKRAAYEIVSAEMRPPKGYKPPKASAARVAANKLPKQVGGNTPVVNEAGRTVPKSVQTVLQLAHKYLGVKYVWGGETPAGFDCSGFVRYLYKQVGIDPGGYTMAQWRNPNAIQVKSQADLEPGDAVFFNWGTHPETGEQGPLHEGLYIGNGLFIQAPRTGDVVKISKMSERSDFLGARRFVRPAGV